MNKPLTPKDCDLRGLPFMPLDVVRLIDSDLFAISTGDEFKAAVALWCKSWLQVPAASLPTDDRVLAHLSGAGSKWKKIKEIALRGWLLCEDGRLYHPVIAEKAMEAMEKRKEHQDHKTNEAERKRLEREDRKRMFSILRSHGIVKAYDTTTAQLRQLVSQVELQQKQEPVTDLSRGQVQDCHAQVTAKTGTGTGTGNIYINTISSNACEKTFDDPPDNRPKFKMYFGWQVSPSFLNDRKGYGFNPNLFTDQVLTEFCGFWQGKNEKLTQGEWEHRLATNLVRLTKNPELSTANTRKSSIPDNNTTDWMTPELVAMLEAQGEHAN